MTQSTSDLQDFEAQLAVPNVTHISRVRNITLDEFNSEYLYKGIPVILEGKLTDWPALHAWTPQFFKTHFPDVPLSAIVNQPEKGSIGFLRHEEYVREISFSKVVDLLEQQEEKCRIGEVPIDMLPGIDKYFDFNDFLDSRNKINTTLFWIGSRGTKSNLHWDMWDNFLAEIYGTKTVVLYSPQQTKYLYPFEGYVRASRIDPYYPDFDTYPKYRDVSVQIGKLEPGDMLFFPKGWWHHLRNVDPTIALNCFFGQGASLWYFIRAATLCGFQQWVNIIRDFFILGVLDRELDRRLRTGDPTGKFFYTLLSGAIKRRLTRFGQKPPPPAPPY